MAAFHPTDEQRKLVEEYVGRGVTQTHIARKLGISTDTLQRHFREELDAGVQEANFLVAGELFKKATGGNLVAMIFWLKTRAGWKETTVQEHTGKDGAPLMDLSPLNPDQLQALASIRLDGE